MSHLHGPHGFLVLLVHMCQCVMCTRRFAFGTPGAHLDTAFTFTTKWIFTLFSTHTPPQSQGLIEDG